MTNLWTERERERLRKLWPTDLTCREIAERFNGRSRSAVIGQAYRLGLPRKP